MTDYYCPSCSKTIKKESFGYPICCSATMRKGTIPESVVKRTIHQLWEMVKELDAYCEEHDVADWELGFIADMDCLRTDQKGYSMGQISHIVRLWGKFCKQ